jgi:hypothetical protein
MKRVYGYYGWNGLMALGILYDGLQGDDLCELGI